MAASTQPLLKTALADGSTLYSEFAEQYMRAADTASGDGVLRPQCMLLGVGVLGAGKHPDASGAYFKLIPPRSSSTSEDSAEAFPEVNLLRPLTLNELGSVKEWLPEDSPGAQLRGFAHSLPRLQRHGSI